MPTPEVQRLIQDAMAKVQEAIEATGTVPGHRASMAKGQLEAAKDSLSRARSFIDAKSSGTWTTIKDGE